MMSGALALSFGRTSSAKAPGLIVSVLDHGARGDGRADDTAAIAAALARAALFPGSRVEFPRGTYRLAHDPKGELLALNGLREISLVGDGAQLVCDTPRDVTSMLKLTDCEDVTIEGLGFRDAGADRTVEWRGAVAIYLTGYGTSGNRNIRIARCRFDNVVSALTVSDGGGRRATNLVLSDLQIDRSYYGLNFQNNGDDVVATGIRCNDVRRAYFPYGVANHRIELDATNNATGFTDVLIKCYGRATSNLAVKLHCRGKRGGDAIVALDQQHASDWGLIRDIDIALDVADTDCRLNSVVLMRALSSEGKTLARTRSEWRNVTLSGTVDYCAANTQMLTIGTQVLRPTTIAMDTELARRVDRSRLRGVVLIETPPAAASTTP